MSARDALINHIIRTLEPHKFERTIDVFELQRHVVHPGHRVIVNGVVYDEKPTKLSFLLHIELHGTGSIISPDGGCEHFELISFGVKVGDKYHGESTNVYYDAVEEFDKHLKNYFNI